MGFDSAAPEVSGVDGMGRAETEFEFCEGMASYDCPDAATDRGDGATGGGSMSAVYSFDAFGGRGPGQTRNE